MRMDSQVWERDQLRKALGQEGIETNVHYPMPIHFQPACAQYGYKRGMLPSTEAMAERIVSVPMYPELTDEQIRVVVSAVTKSTGVGVSNL